MIRLQILEFIVILGFCATQVPVFAQLPPLIHREVLSGNPEKFNPRLSPDGKLLAYIAPDQGVLNIWVCTIGQKDHQVVTADKKRGIQSFIWQVDGQHVLYRQDRDGSEDWHIYQTNIRTKSTRDLTPFQGVQADIVAINPKFPDQMLVALNLRDRKLFDVHRIDLKSGAVEMDTQNSGDVAGWLADSNLQVRGLRAHLPDGSIEIRVRDNASSSWRSIKKWSGDDTGDFIAFTPGGKGIWLTSSENADAKGLIEVDLLTGRVIVLAQDKQYDVYSILRNPQTRALEAVLFVRARSEWMIVDKSIEADFNALRKVRDGDFYISSRDPEDKTWVVHYITDDGPVYYYTYDRNTKQATLLFSDRPSLENYKLAKMQPISFQARDGMTIHGYLTLPVGIEPKNLPLVLLVHGGPWTRDYWGLNLFVQLLANRGYAVLQVNFRGSTGYGKTHYNAGNREWGGKMNMDLLDGKDWAVRQGYVDPKKVCVLGPSYGGYAVLAGLAFTPNEFACGVDFYGPSNLITFLRNMTPVFSTSRGSFDKRIGNVETEEGFLKSRSPFFHADQIKAPLLIFQGANDPRVPQAESDQIVAAIRKNSGQVEYIVFPDEGHGIIRPENSRKANATIEQFLAKYLGGRAEPLSEKEKVDALRR